MIIGFPETEDCMRCSGKGYYFTKLGYPGQDVRVVGYSNIRWQPTTGPFWCDACKATGRKELRSAKQTGPRFVNIPAD